LEKVIVKMTGGVEDLDADEAAVLPVERDEPFGAWWHRGPDPRAPGDDLNKLPILASNGVTFALLVNPIWWLGSAAASIRLRSRLRLA
jgi:hypothetical protein